MYSQIEELELIQKVKNNNDNDSLLKLVAAHTGILWNYARKYSVSDRPTCNLEEMFSNRFEIVFKACQNFNPERDYKFSTFLGNMSKWAHCRVLDNLLEKSENSYDPDELTTLKDFGYYCEDNHENIEEYFEFLKDEPRMLELMKLRYLSGKTWSEIGVIMGFSHTFAMMTHDKSIAIIKKQLNKTLQTV